MREHIFFLLLAVLCKHAAGKLNPENKAPRGNVAIWWKPNGNIDKRCLATLPQGTLWQLKTLFGRNQMATL